MGKVFIVGAGPGDVDLITVRGLRCIEQADVILYDRLVNKDLLAYAKKGAKLIFCGKLPNRHAMIQDHINHSLVSYAQQGFIVTRLKGGDPFVFGRGAEEAEVLAQHHIPFEVVPGITSGIAAPAYAGIPVTHRDLSSSFAMVTGHMREGKDDGIQWESLAKGIDTLAIYMGVGNLPYIQQQLLQYGRDAQTPVALIHWGTCAQQKTVLGTLATIVDVVQQEEIQNPSMIVIGKVVTLREKIQWFEEVCPQMPFKEMSV
ncbi:uroporphyrinogen-III C-methyltransferase [Lysinibacillus sphaericus]|uniref:Uroporphyrinogen-III C-methyltransferase n=2 Tax=Lysinibacillus TaxID=400634 RepID=A0A2S0JXE4_LYSSH|nr:MULTISPECIES: uroporphyrinogen-III C-methyltransferase [Lysinibacillus]AVK95739.1 uroporphyrinogen-III C-methyltransferase [Lysinibacillus sphaericus]MCS1382816.1 uroporphyrinogen-III C-methyltransferase [Lysinibacillus sphaericus]MED4546063.1 uroporphyrinogen-III C-methyltransferase [Lysinibacillus sphaericus]TKI16288.1 uroporphyrinogen-III C-methyltransferase [Lysinibacillus sphaericus]TKI46155.1 uroporphyrinogen-III C-methyltransferase [Lysinibacillus tabacifolii]